MSFLRGVICLLFFVSGAPAAEQPTAAVPKAELVPGVHTSVPFGYFGIEGKIEEMLGAKVDFMTEPAQKPWLQEEIDRDRVHVF